MGVFCVHKPGFLMPGHIYVFEGLIIVAIYVSLSTVVLNSRDWWEIVWLPENFTL